MRIKYPRPSERRARAIAVARTHWVVPHHKAKQKDIEFRVQVAWQDGFNSCMRHVQAQRRNALREFARDAT